MNVVNPMNGFCKLKSQLLRSFNNFPMVCNSAFVLPVEPFLNLEYVWTLNFHILFIDDRSQVVFMNSYLPDRRLKM